MIESGELRKSAATLKGYDNMTGIGAPRGQAFISVLRKRESSLLSRS